MQSKIAKKIIFGNWKMNPVSVKEAEKLLKSISKDVSGVKRTEIVVCPPFLYLESLKNLSKKIKLGAQDAFWGESGAFTGQISPVMLYNTKVKYVILGHSEKRELGENNIQINKKIKSTLSAEISPVLCVGESFRDENHNYFNLVKSQIEECLDGLNKNLISKIIIAYEPVWALSTTVNRIDAMPADSLEMSIFIRKVLTDKFGFNTEMPKIVYGGSVNEKNSMDFLKNGGVDGLLVGRSSLDPKKFIEIIKICENLN